MPRLTIERVLAEQVARARAAGISPDEFIERIRALQFGGPEDEALAAEIERRRRGRAEVSVERYTDLAQALHVALNTYFDSAPGESMWDFQTPLAGVNMLTGVETVIVSHQFDRSGVFLSGFSANTAAPFEVTWRVYANSQLIYESDNQQPTADTFTLFPLRQEFRQGSVNIEVRGTKITAVATLGRARIHGWHLPRDPLVPFRNHR